MLSRREFVKRGGLFVAATALLDPVESVRRYWALDRTMTDAGSGERVRRLVFDESAYLPGDRIAVDWKSGNIYRAFDFGLDSDTYVDFTMSPSGHYIIVNAHRAPHVSEG